MKFKIIETPLSTHIYGDFDLIMSSLITEIKTTFEKAEGVMINLKIVKGDRFNYKANF